MGKGDDSGELDCGKKSSDGVLDSVPIKVPSGNSNSIEEIGDGVEGLSDRTR